MKPSLLLHRTTLPFRPCPRFLAVVIAFTLPAATDTLRADCSLVSTGAIPLDDAGPRFYKGYQCGLYPGGANARPPLLDAAAVNIAGQLLPLDANGNVDTAVGKVVMISVGLSNTTDEFGSLGPQNFKARADADPAKNPQLVIVDGAQGGKDAPAWADVNAPTWTVLESRLTAAGLTPKQVQVCWLKEALSHEANYGDFPRHAQTLQTGIAAIARNLKTRYPNIRLCYLASRTRAYTDVAALLNPEPFAFETGFADKWVIEDQIAGRNNLNSDPSKGTVVAPLLLWGPYIWADGTTPRSDGFTWLCSDTQNDFTHPSATGGVPKVATQLLTFFKTDPTATPWFLNRTAPGKNPTVQAAASVASGDAPLNVNFTASATTDSGTITSYQWTFDDGTFSTAQNPTKTFPAPGSYQAHLTVTDSNGNTARRALPITVTQSVAGWKSVYFTTAEQSDPAISGPLADPDGDGIPNLAEYALGTRPKQPDAGKLPVAGKSGDGHLTLTYPQAKADIGAKITVEVAGDLRGPWDSGAPFTGETITADDGVVQTVLSTDLMAISDATARFMRLKIESTTAPAILLLPAAIK